MDNIIIVITYLEKGKRFVDYGIDKDGKTVIMPQVPVTWMQGLKYDSDMGEHYLEDNYERA
jgi:hypothetical protein